MRIDDAGPSLPKKYFSTFLFRYHSADRVSRIPISFVFFCPSPPPDGLLFSAFVRRPRGRIYLQRIVFCRADPKLRGEQCRLWPIYTMPT